MTGNADRPPPGLGPDDPLLSEWLDGRLDAAAAAEVQRAVRASPELTLLVEELRGLKAVLADQQTSAPPAGFVGRVMEAVAATGAETDDPAVEEEWRRLEEQRLAEERAEACEDAAEPARPPLPRWGWLAIAGALAAGLLVAALVNVPRDAGREVAVNGATPVARPTFLPAGDDLGDDDLGAGGAADEQSLADARPAETRALPAAPVDAPLTGDELAPTARRQEERFDRDQSGSGRSLAENALRREAAEPSGESERGRPPMAFKAAAPAAANGAGAGVAPQSRPAAAAEARVVTVRIDGARGRDALARLIDAVGLKTAAAPVAADRARDLGRETSAAAAGAERIEVVGDRQAVAALFTALGQGSRETGLVLAPAGPGRKQSAPSLIEAEGRAGAGTDATAGTDGDAAAARALQAPERIVIVIVEDPTLGAEPAETPP